MAVASESETLLREEVEEHLRAIGGCREETGKEKNWGKCEEPADFVLWGKLFPKEALGPRCAIHAFKHVKRHIEQSAVVDLRPLRKLLVDEPTRKERNGR